MIELSNYLYRPRVPLIQPALDRAHSSWAIIREVWYFRATAPLFSVGLCLDNLRWTQWGHTTLARRDQITSNYTEKTSSAQGLKTATQRQKKSRLMELFQNQQNGRREATRTSKVTLRTRNAPVYRKQNQNWGKPDDVTSDATKSACASGNFHWDALDCACPLGIPKSGYKSSQRSRSPPIPSEDLATDTLILSLFGSTCICFST